jgi:peptidoglycan/LPS O-acetylase OafA/YrhL
MREPTRGDSAGYVPELDTYRTLAILLVMCLHWLPDKCWINRIQSAGNLGVYLFFVLSGFLITRILMRCRENSQSGKSTRAFSLRQFYIRRFLRIFPLYYLVLAITAIAAVPGVRHALIWHAAYLSNLFYSLRLHRGMGFDGPASHLWTLSVEEQFYLFWPLAILLLPRRTLIPFVVGAVLIGTVIHGTARIADSTAWSLTTPACLNFLATGALVAVCESPACGSQMARERLLRIYLVLTGVIIAGCAVLWLVPFKNITLKLNIERALCQTMASVLFAWIIAKTAEGISGPFGRILRFGPAVYLGRISYGLYIYHQFVRWALEQHWPALLDRPGNSSANIAAIFAVRFLATVSIASISWFAFERPINDLKRFFPYFIRRDAGAAALPTAAVSC